MFEMMLAKVKNRATVYDRFYDMYLGKDENLPSVIPSPFDEGLQYEEICTNFFAYFFTEENMEKFFKCFEEYRGQIHGDDWDEKEELKRIINNAFTNIFFVLQRELALNKSSKLKSNILNEFENHLTTFFKKLNLLGVYQKRFLGLMPDYYKRANKKIKENIALERRKNNLYNSNLIFHLPGLTNMQNSSFITLHDELFQHFIGHREGNTKKELFSFLKDPESLSKPYNWVGTKASFVCFFKYLNRIEVLKYNKSFWDKLNVFFLYHAANIPDTIKHTKEANITINERKSFRILDRSFSRLLNINSSSSRTNI